MLYIAGPFSWYIGGGRRPAQKGSTERRSGLGYIQQRFLRKNLASDQTHEG
jgi:hypothetical protein